jgi:thioredoxin-related protein
MRSITLLVLAVVFSVAQARQPREPGLPFSNDLEATLQAAQSEGKPVVLSFVAAWCPLCTRMKKVVFRDPAVLSLADDFLWIKIDIDRQLSIAQSYAVEGTPLNVILDPNGQQRVKLLGFQEPAELHDNLTGYLERANATTTTATQALLTPDTSGPNSELTWKPKGYRSRAICFSHVGYGPLALPSQSPFQALRLAMRPRTPSTLGKGQFEGRVTSTWVNIWAVDDGPIDERDYTLDFEMLQTAVTLAYGILDTLEIEGEFQNRSRFGGSMDNLTQGFHDLFGVDQNGRDTVPKGEFTLQLAPPGQPAVAVSRDDRGSFSRSVQASIQHNVTCGNAKLPAFSYSLSTRLETLDAEDLGSDLDVGVSVAASRRFGRIYLNATLGYAWFGQDNFRGIELNDTQYSWLLAMEWRFRPKHSLLVQHLSTEGLIDGFAPFSDASNEITLGWKWELRRRGMLEVGLVENIIEYDNSPDFGIHLGFSQRF